VCHRTTLPTALRKYVWTEQATEKKYCLNCAAGKYTKNGFNQKECFDKADLEAATGNDHGDYVYPDEAPGYHSGVHEDAYQLAGHAGPDDGGLTNGYQRR
jgi:hypothetical protein